MSDRRSPSPMHANNKNAHGEEEPTTRRRLRRATFIDRAESLRYRAGAAPPISRVAQAALAGWGVRREGRRVRRVFEVNDRPKMVKRALLVGAYERTSSRPEAESLLEELEELVDTLGIPVMERMLVHIREVHARLFLGTGKAQEIADLVKARELDVIIFDNELTPAQQRNWEELSGVTVIDRQEVIIDIFGKRAQTREARLQVVLARMEYALPRLTGAWNHFGQQAGAVGVRGGEGESQLELDRRMVRVQIDRLKRDLVQVRTRRATQRKDRKRVPVPNAAIVGYTNSGKSSLLRRLTQADVLVEDKLFATLDTTTRRLLLPNNQVLLLTDTVGFVRKLPHRLVDAFHATLEEAVQADFLIHLLDASQPEVENFHATTRDVLQELGALDKPTIIALNKIDLVDDPERIADLRRQFPDAVVLSVRTGEGMDDLTGRMMGLLEDQLVTLHLRIPMERSDIVAGAYQDGQVLELDYVGGAADVVATIPSRLRWRYDPFAVNAG